MKKLFMALVGIGFFTQPTWAADWVPAAESNSEIYLVDHESIKINLFKNGGKYITAWVQVNYRTERKHSNGKPYSSAKFFYYIDCNNKKVDMESVVGYNKHGQSAFSHTFPVSTQSSATWSRIVPDSTGYFMINHVCSQVKQ